MRDPEIYRELGEQAWSWTLAQVRDDDGPWLPETVTDEPPARPADDRDSLYAGIAGLAPVLAEIASYRPLTGTERVLADGITERLARSAGERTEPSLYDGLAGFVTGLRLLAPGRERDATARLAGLATPDGWPTTIELEPGVVGPPFTDVIMGTAGIVMTGAWVGGADGEALMSTGGEALLRVAEPAGGGLDWRMHPGYRSSSPNFSHGTAGAAAALAVAGRLLCRDDFVEAARAGARYLFRVAETPDGGFVVPHTIPPSTREVEPLTYTWCHGPTGTSLLFAALLRAGVTEIDGQDVADLRRRCLRTVLAAGVPQRLRPGFWDNDGRCCGTAGVGDALLDAAQDSHDGFEMLLRDAAVMGDALVDRAIRDGSGARWRFVEYRQEEPLLPPGTSWMQGSAGIAAFLLRLARVCESGVDAPVVDRPDQWWAVPATVRTAAAYR